MVNKFAALSYKYWYKIFFFYLFVEECFNFIELKFVFYNFIGEFLKKFFGYFFMEYISC